MASDGGIFSFGSAAFYGLTPALVLAPVTAITATTDGKGYWEAASNGAVYSHGDAASFGANGHGARQARGRIRSFDPELRGGPQGMTPPAGYSATQMTFDDTFSGSSLDSSNWTPELAPGSVWNDESLPSGDSSAGSNQAAYWAPSQATVNNGLTLSARQTTSSDVGYAKGFNWVSGAVTSNFTLPSTGWYVQIEAQMPDTSDGMWPALWFLPRSSAQEFDGLEGGWKGSNPNDQGHSDLFLGSGQQQDVWSTPGGTNITAGYNTYGFQYIPGQSVTTYFNGQQVYSGEQQLDFRPGLLPDHRAAGRLVVHFGLAHRPVVEHAEPLQHEHLRGPGLPVGVLVCRPSGPRPRPLGPVAGGATPGEGTGGRPRPAHHRVSVLTVPKRWSTRVLKAGASTMACRVGPPVLARATALSTDPAPALP